MRAKTIWRAALLTVILALAPRAALAQPFSLGYAPADPIVPLPYGSLHPDTGIYTFLEFLMLRQTNPLQNQVIMTRGFFDINSQIPGQGANHIGSDTDALDTNQIRGPGAIYQPSFRIGMGYKFNDESSLSLSWLHIFQIRYQAVATAVPANFNIGANFADSFISAPVYNFPNDFAGPPGLQNGPNGVRAALSRVLLTGRLRLSLGRRRQVADDRDLLPVHGHLRRSGEPPVGQPPEAPPAYLRSRIRRGTLPLRTHVIMIT